MRVLVFGTFDLLHNGHKSLFAQARALAENVELHVVIARDETVRRVKGAYPSNSEFVRFENVKRYADNVYLGHLTDRYKVIEEIDPDVIALGYDQTHFVDSLPSQLRARGLKASIVRLEAFEPEKYKSSLLRDGDATPDLDRSR